MTLSSKTEHLSDVHTQRSPLLPTANRSRGHGKTCGMLARAFTSAAVLLTTGCCDDIAYPFTADDIVEPDESTSGDTDQSGSSGAEATDSGIVWGEGDCCEQAGDKFGGICLLSDFDGGIGAGGEVIPPSCIGCDWKPVLCMKQGCKTPNATDCCLNDKGQTVACNPG